MAWAKGQSGNASGRALLTPEQRKAIDKARKLTPWAIERLAQLADNGDPRVALAACVALAKIGGVMTEADPLRLEQAIEARLNTMIAEAEARQTQTPQLPPVDVTPHTGRDGESGKPKP